MRHLLITAAILATGCATTPPIKLDTTTPVARAAVTDPTDAELLADIFRTAERTPADPADAVLDFIIDSLEKDLNLLEKLVEWAELKSFEMKGLVRDARLDPEEVVAVTAAYKNAEKKFWAISQAAEELANHIISAAALEMGAHVVEDMNRFMRALVDYEAAGDSELRAEKLAVRLFGLVNRAGKAAGPFDEAMKEFRLGRDG